MFASFRKTSCFFTVNALKLFHAKSVQQIFRVDRQVCTDEKHIRWLTNKLFEVILFQVCIFLFVGKQLVPVPIPISVSCAFKKFTDFLS